MKKSQTRLSLGLRCLEDESRMSVLRKQKHEGVWKEVGESNLG